MFKRIVHPGCSRAGTPAFAGSATSARSLPVGRARIGAVAELQSRGKRERIGRRTRARLRGGDAGSGSLAGRGPGQRVGHKKIDCFAAVTCDAVRIRVTRSVAEPRWKQVAAHYAGTIPSFVRN